MEWSETQPIGLLWKEGPSLLPYAFHNFEMYRLAACGVELFENYSSHWTAMVDTGAACLSLPLEFFEMVTAWAPGLDCVSESIPEHDYR